ncbi:LysR family transcriptional regulator [Aquabacterium sp.]|uniref:LysR family transcriptional regulator n=1 Tax=Aquabacterium sp. TaxID=1872578 RepID=UPI002C6605CF|nr:LysR family transcriptional regulator [Aquabacterium sp.]HSW07383.1 LysR family transcriptional regulator [Aquabacterium sp.]
MTLTHRHVEVFRALMLAGTVTRAAELLHTSQPTVSRELARLEQVLQMNLFDRVRGRLRPTVRALVLRDEIERSYIGLERIAATASSLRHFSEGRLTIACLPALAHALLPEATRRFVARHAQASVAITPLESPLLETWLTEQRCDLGLTEQTQAPPGTSLLPLLQLDEVAVLPAGHPLLARRVLKLQDFAGQPFISLAPEDAYRQQLDALFAQAGVARVQALEAGSAVAVCALVREGLGLAIVNPLTALAFAGDALQMRPLSVQVPFHVGLVSPELRPPSPLREGFTAALREAAADVRQRLKRRLTNRPASPGA